MLLRPWLGTLIANLAGGWLFTWLIVRGYPDITRTAIESGFHYAQRWAALGTIVGRVGLVTVLRLLQVPHRVRRERRHPALGVALGDHRRVDDGKQP